MLFGKCLQRKFCNNKTFMYLRKNRRKGFSLPEIIIAIVIMAILAVLLMPKVLGLVEKANVSHDKQDAASMSDAISRFTAEYEAYDNGEDEANVSDLTRKRVEAVFTQCGITVNKSITRQQFADFEVDSEHASAGQDKIAQDTKFPLSKKVFCAVIKAYDKTAGSKSFVCNQKHMEYFYNWRTGNVTYAKSASDLVKSAVTNKEYNNPVEADYIELKDEIGRAHV